MNQWSGGINDEMFFDFLGMGILPDGLLNTYQFPREKNM